MTQQYDWTPITFTTENGVVGKARAAIVTDCRPHFLTVHGRPHFNAMTFTGRRSVKRASFDATTKEMRINSYVFRFHYRQAFEAFAKKIQSIYHLS